MSILLAFSALLCLGYCSHVDLSAYPLSSVLRADGSGTPLFTLYWNFSTVEQTISFAVRAQTNGWVGLGISPNGGMRDSDVVIGWVNDDGKPFLHVSYPFVNAGVAHDHSDIHYLISPGYHLDVFHTPSAVSMRAN